MKLFGYEITKSKNSIIPDFKHTSNAPSKNAYSTFSYAVSFNGEKNLGEIGPIKQYSLDYDALRLRSWQSLLESEISQTVLSRYSKWVIGKGLKLQAEPVRLVLESEKIKITPQEFSELTEARFGVFAMSNESDYAKMSRLHKIARRAFVNSIVGGDVLAVLRLVNKQLSVQLIDGAHVCSPVYGTEKYGYTLESGNVIRHGIEMSPAGEHVAYWVKTKDYKWERIPAKGKESGLVTAFMIYGLEYRLDNVRGLPLFAVVLETLKKLERYKEATVGSAEERQKIAFSVEHQIGSTGENPLAKNMAKAFNVDATEDIPIDVQGKQLADTVAASTNKQAFNLPIGSKLNMLESKNELYFKDFYTTNINILCACVGIPPEVAMSKYDSNFSASRAALKDWEHTLNVEREDFGRQFYQNIYNFWLEVEILSNKISAPGYVSAKIANNYMAINAYRNARWVGASVPHIDPEKEVRAERLKLGEAAANIPLTNLESSTEVLNSGESNSNLEQFAKELQKAKDLNIIPKQTNNNDQPN